MKTLGWIGIVRLGLVQAAMGSVVVLTTSTLNRVMVVELALPALLPGFLVALHYLVQVARPRMGHGSDIGGRRTPWIIGGMTVLAFGGVLAALATAWMASNRPAGMALAVLAFILIGLGVSACGTSLLVMLAKQVAEGRRAGAATVVWMMMIAGFAITGGLAGHWLDPYSPQRMVLVSSVVSALAVAIALAALYRLEPRADQPTSVEATPSPPPKPAFRAALAQVWSEPTARRFTIFVFISMLAYSAQDLILEPFAGTVYGLTPGATTQLSGMQHGGVLLGMLLVALAGSTGTRLGSLRGWTVGGCIASALALISLAAAGVVGPGWPLLATVFLLGVSNGAFSIGAIATMMRLASEGRHAREGVRMGLWGAAQAIAFGMGGLLGTAASDLARWLLGAPGIAYASVFLFEGVMFLVAGWLAWRIGANPALATRRATPPPAGGDALAPR